MILEKNREHNFRNKHNKRLINFTMENNFATRSTQLKRYEIYKGTDRSQIERGAIELNLY